MLHYKLNFLCVYAHEYCRLPSSELVYIFLTADLKVILMCLLLIHVLVCAFIKRAQFLLCKIFKIIIILA